MVLSHENENKRTWPTAAPLVAGTGPRLGVPRSHWGTLPSFPECGDQQEKQARLCDATTSAVQLGSAQVGLSTPRDTHTPVTCVLIDPNALATPDLSVQLRLGGRGKEAPEWLCPRRRECVPSSKFCHEKRSGSKFTALTPSPPPRNKGPLPLPLPSVSPWVPGKDSVLRREVVSFLLWQ